MPSQITNAVDPKLITPSESKGTLEIIGRGYFAPQNQASDRLEIIDLLNSQITSVHTSLSLDPVLPTIRLLQTTHAVSEYVEFYNHERPHQGLDNELVVSQLSETATKDTVKVRSRLGGLLNFYYR